MGGGFATHVLRRVAPEQAMRVTMPTPDYELFENALAETANMKAPLVNCDSPGILTSKYVSGDLATAAPQVYNLIANMKVTSSSMEWLLAEYNQATTDQGWDGIEHYTAACAWVKENYLTWSTWMNEYACEGGECV